MNLPFGEAVLIRAPFHQTGGAKIRPAVVVLDAGDDHLIAVPIDSKPRNSKYDLPIQNWRMRD